MHYFYSVSVSFNIILFLQSLQTYFIYPNLQPFFCSLPWYFLSGIFTLTWLYSLIFLLLLGSGHFTPYRCLFLTLYFSSTLELFLFLSQYIHCEMKYLHLSFNTFHFLSMSSSHRFFSPSTKIRSDEIQPSFYCILSHFSPNGKLNMITVIFRTYLIHCYQRYLPHC